MLRESIRRSFRQIRDMTTPVHTPGNTVTSMAAMAEMELGRANRDDHHQTSITSARHLPPAYTSVILEMRSHGSDSLRPGILSDRLSQLVDCESTEASTTGSSSSSSSSSACSSTTDCTGTTSSSSSDTTSSAPMTAAELTRLLRDSFRRSARNTLRNSLRFIRKNVAKPADSTERSVTDDDDTTDTDQGARHLVNGAVRIHRDPSLANVVVTLPNATGNHSESIAWVWFFSSQFVCFSLFFNRPHFRPSRSVIFLNNRTIFLEKSSCRLSL